MRKLLLGLISVFCLYSISFCADIPSVDLGSASIKTDGLPSGSKPPSEDEILKTDNIKGSIPTNKWFNSILWNTYKSPIRMYTYPQTIKCNKKDGLFIGLPIIYYSAHSRSYEGEERNIEELNYGIKNNYTNPKINTDNYPNCMEVFAYKNLSGNALISTSTKLDDYGNWSATAIWTDKEEPEKYMKATFGQGFVFTYFEFEETLYPVINVPCKETDTNYENYKFYCYKDDGNILSSTDTAYQNDKMILKVSLPNKDVFYGIFIPEKSEFRQQIDNDNICKKITIYASEEVKEEDSYDNYISIALLPSTNETEAVEDLKEYYKYAYNFVSTTSVTPDIKQNNNFVYAITDFQFSFNVKREKKDNNNLIEKQTLFCLFPHQYNNIDTAPTPYPYHRFFENTLRGKLQIYSDSRFSTKVKFNGIIPFLNHSINNTTTKVLISTSLLKDAELDINPPSEKRNTYYYGKNLAKIANLIPVSHNIYDITSDTTTDLIEKVKKELINWFKYSTGEDSKYFAFDQTWGGLIGIKTGFGSENYSDHNFHYGYYIYASAIVAMYDIEFVQNYGKMVELLIKDIANNDKNDTKSFPYMRCFDFYESHSWASGMGGADDYNSINIESSSEAMNAWAAIYLWGIATNNQNYIDLGIYLYCNEYEAIKKYFFDIDKKILTLNSNYNHCSIGILYGGSMQYGLHWAWKNYAREIKGIQLLPMNASMLYLGYDKKYAEEKFYEEMTKETKNQTEYNENKNYWNDIWTRFEALFNPEQAWTDFTDNHDVSMIDDGGTATYTYHFIDFFKLNGIPETNYSASIPSYLVTKKDNKTVFSAYNYKDTIENIYFYDSTGEKIGYMTVPAKQFASTDTLKKDVIVNNFFVRPIPYKPNSNGNYGGDGIYFYGVSEGTNIKIFNVAGELVYNKTVDTVISKEGKTYYLWDARNNSGNKIASGVYIYYIITPDGTKHKGKLAIER